MGKRKTNVIGFIIVVILFIIQLNIVFAGIVSSHSHVSEIDDFEVDLFFIGNYYSENVVYSHGRWWAVTYEETSFDIWIYNSTDRVNWFGSEASAISVEMSSSVEGYGWLLSTLDSQGDLHIYWKEQGSWNQKYMKVELESDGSMNPLAEQTAYSYTNMYPVDIAVDGQDYPVVLFRATSAPRKLRIAGSTTKDGTWTSDYLIVVYEAVTGFTLRGILVPMSGNSGKDWLVVYSKSVAEPTLNFQTECRYFDEPTETLGVAVEIDSDRFTSEGDNSSGRSKYWNSANGVTTIYQNNETFITIWGWDDVNNKRNLGIYRTTNGGQTWSKKIIYEMDASATTDFAGHIPRMDNNDNLIVFYRHNDIHEGNHTFFYSQLNNENIATGFTGVWDTEGTEIYDGGVAEIYDQQYEGSLVWSITTGGIAWDKFAIGFGVDSHDGNDEPCLHVFSEAVIEEEEEEEYPPPELVNITVRGYEDYLFMGEVYEIDSYWNNTDYCYFELNDTEHVWRYFYYNETDYMGIDVIGFDGLITNELVIGSPFVNITTGYTGSGENLTRLQWKFILDRQVVDCFNRTLSYYGENYWNNVTSGNTSYTEINIYNLGGYVTYEFGGDGIHIVGGDAFELEVTNATQSSYAYAETIFRRLQQVHLLTELYTEMDWNAVWEFWDIPVGEGMLEFGIDYKLDGTWVTGWRCEIHINTGNIGHHGVGQDKAYIRLAVKWWNRNILIKTDYIYAYNYAYFPSGDNSSSRHSTPIFVDLWFNKMNSSTVVGGRVTPYYLGIQEKGWWGFGNIRPLYGDSTTSMFFGDLQNGSDVVITSQQLEMVKFWTKIRKMANDDHTWNVHNYEILNWQLAPDRMGGVDTPIFVQPKIPEITLQHGFLQPLYKAISSLASDIWKGALGVSKIFIGAIDSFLSFLGLPEGTFTSLVNLISGGFSQLFSMLGYVIDQISNMLTMISGMLSFVLTYITGIVNSIMWALTLPLAIIGNIYTLIAGAFNGVDVTVWGITYNFSDYYGLVAAGKEILPMTVSILFVYWFMTGDPMGNRDDEGVGIPKRVVAMFGYMRDIFKSIFWVFNYIRNEVISIYNFIRSHIPTIGGGGGETEE